MRQAGLAPKDAALVARPAGPRPPLSFGQERLWFLAQLDPSSTAYHMCGAWRLVGRLDVGTLGAALNHVVARHEALRTTLPEEGGQAYQSVAPELAVPLAIEEIDASEPDGEDELVAARVRAEERHGFDLSVGPLMRMKILRFAPERHVVIIAMHHVITDGWSNLILLGELSAAYRAMSRGKFPELPTLPVQYRDYAWWQREQAAGPATQASLKHWIRRLRDVPPLRLPTLRGRPRVMSARGGAIQFTMPATLMDKVQAVARRQGVTAFAAVLTAFQVLMRRLSGQDDFAVGVPVLGRSRKELEHLIGFFENTLAIRSDLAGNPTAREAMTRTAARVVEAVDHGEVPFERIVDQVQPDRRLDAHPVFQVMFVMREADPMLDLGDVEARSLPVGRESSMFDLVVQIEHTAGAGRGRITFNLDLFTAADVERMAQQLLVVLDVLCEDPEQRISDFDVSTPAERAQRRQFNETTTAPAPRALLQTAFFEQAERQGSRTAVVDHGREFSYGEVARAVNHLAGQFVADGLTPGDRVALVMSKGWAQIVGVLAVLDAGGVYVPIDAALPADRIQALIADAGATHGVLDGTSRGRVPSAGVSWHAVDDRVFAATAGPRQAVAREPDDVAYIIYTSGSTGKPKGVVINHAGAVNTIADINRRWNVSGDDRVLALSSMSFDLSVYDVFGLLGVGGALVMVNHEGAQDPDHWLRMMRDHGVTIWNSVPALMSVLVDYLEVHDAVMPEALRLVLMSGDWIPTNLPGRIRACGGEGAALVSLGGATEASIWSVFYPIETVGEDWPSIPYGRPLAHQQLLVLDENLWPCPTLVEGDLYIGGAGLALEYHRDPVKTGGSFIVHPKSRERLYRTGDRARFLPSGELEFLGRQDFQVKIQGFRVELGEIEYQLVQMPEVREAVVVARGDRGDRKQLVAYLVAAGKAPNEERVRARLSATLPDYMVPTAIVLLAQLPLTPNGKVDRAALPSPQSLPVARVTGVVPPRTEAERILAEIFRGLLKRDEIGVDDDFFALGGDSILTIQVVSRARKAGLALRPRDVFDNPTLAALARAAEAGRTVIAADQALIEGQAPITPIQRWFFDRELDHPHHFNQAVMLATTANVTEEVVRQALRAVVAQHDALRLRFSCEDDQWVARHDAEIERSIAVESMDPSQLRDEAARRVAIEQRAALAQEQLDFEQGPLLRTVLFDCGLDGTRILLVVHHLVIDGVSWRLLLEDFLGACQAIAAGTAPKFPPKTTSFKAWADALIVARRRLSPEVVSSVSERLVCALVEIGVGGEGGRESDATSSEVRFDAEFTRSLLGAGLEAYRLHPDELMLAALAPALFPWCGREVVWLDLEAHGRTHDFADVDLSRTVGWFTRLDLVRLDASAHAPDLDARIKAVKEQVRGGRIRGLAASLLRFGIGPTPPAVPPPRPPVVFNYLGQLDAGFDQIPGVAMAPESVGQTHANEQSRAHALEVSAAVASGELVVRFTHRVDEPGLAALTGDFSDGLRSLVEHCLAEGSGGYTPSDFLDCGLDQAELDGLIGRSTTVVDVSQLGAAAQSLTASGIGRDAAASSHSVTFDGVVTTEIVERAVREVAVRRPVLAVSLGWVMGRSDPRMVTHARPVAPVIESAGSATDALAAEGQGWRLDAIDDDGGEDLRTRLTWLIHPLLMTGFNAVAVLREVAAMVVELTAVAVREPPRAVDGIERREIASLQQQRFWFLAELDRYGTYHHGGLLRLEGPMDVSAFRAAIDAVIQRHEVLRTTFELRGGRALQRVHAAQPIACELVDLCGIPPEGREASLADEARAFKLAPFDLRSGPLLRVRLFQLGADHFVAAVVVHHAIFDHWSWGVLIADIGTQYRSHVASGRPVDAPLDLQYAEWSLAEARSAARDQPAAMEFWSQQLANAPVVELPTAHPRPAAPSDRATMRAFRLPKSIASAAHEFAIGEGATAYAVFMAAYQAVIARYARLDDVCVGTAVAGRDALEQESMIGCFMKMVVVRGDLREQPSFRQLVRRTADTVRDVFDHDNLPFEALHAADQASGGKGATAPTFSVQFIFQNAPTHRLELEGLAITAERGAVGGLGVDLSLELYETADELLGELSYRTELFDEGWADAFARHFEMLVRAGIDQPDECVYDLPMVSDAERADVVHTWNETRANLDLHRAWHEHVQETAEMHRDAIAVEDRSGTLTYGQLDRRANAFAHLLAERGAGRGDRVAVVFDRCNDLLTCLLGVLKVGAAYVPLNPEDPPARLAALIADARPVLVVVQRIHRDALAVGAGVLAIDAIEAEADAPPVSGAAGGDAAYLLFTSGSTGRPKGVVVSHAALVNRLLWMQGAYGLSSRDVVLQKTPYTFDVSGWEFWWPLLVGARLVMAPPGAHRDPSAIAGLINYHRVTTCHFVPSMLGPFLATPEARSCSSLDRVFCSGEALLAEQCRRFFEVVPSSELHNLYGPTEAAIDVSFHPCESAQSSPVPIGRPVWNTQLYVLDPRGAPCPPGIPGELHIGGVQLATCYHDRPDLTAAAFIPDPFGADGGRLYRTGDLVCQRIGGVIEYRGRIDHQVKLRGMRIELGEIDTVLAAMPNVETAVTLLRDDVGGGGGHLVAYVVSRDGAALESVQLRDRLTGLLPEHMVPSHFVALDEVPLTSSGKINRRELPRPETITDSTTIYVAPRTPLERKLAAIWQDVLKVERVGAHDDFFRLGGHSLLIMQVHAAIRQELGVDLPLGALFDRRTVEAIAEAIAREVPQGGALDALRAAAQARRESGVVPTSCIEDVTYGLWEEGCRSPWRISQQVLRVRGPFDSGAFESAVAALLGRHEVLRSRYARGEAGIVKKIGELLPLPIHQYSSTASTEAERWEEIRRQAAAEYSRGFNLNTEGPLRIGIGRLNAETHIIVITRDHIAWDASSHYLVVQELAVSYQQATMGIEPSRAPVPIQYADFAYWQRHLNGELAAFWQTHLEGSQPLNRQLRTDGDRLEVEARRGDGVFGANKLGRAGFVLGTEVMAGLQSTTARLGVGTHAICYAAFTLLMSEWSDTTDITLANFVNYRARVPGIESLIGFVGGFSLSRIQLQQDWSVEALLGAAQREAHEVARHDHYPLIPLVFPQFGDMLRVVMNFLPNPPAAAFPAGALVVEPIDESEIGRDVAPTTHYDLFLQIFEGDGALSGCLNFNADLWSATSGEAMARGYARILERLVCLDPRTPVRKILGGDR